MSQPPASLGLKSAGIRAWIVCRNTRTHCLRGLCDNVDIDWVFVSSCKRADPAITTISSMSDVYSFSKLSVTAYLTCLWSVQVCVCFCSFFKSPLLSFVYRKTIKKLHCRIALSKAPGLAWVRSDQSCFAAR